MMCNNTQAESPAFTPSVSLVFAIQESVTSAQWNIKGNCFNRIQVVCCRRCDNDVLSACNSRWCSTLESLIALKCCQSLHSVFSPFHTSYVKSEIICGDCFWHWWYFVCFLHRVVSSSQQVLFCVLVRKQVHPLPDGTLLVGFQVQPGPHFCNHSTGHENTSNMVETYPQ